MVPLSVTWGDALVNRVRPTWEALGQIRLLLKSYATHSPLHQGDALRLLDD